MSNSLVFYEALDQFLEGRGFHAHMRRHEVDGHMIRYTLTEIQSSSCAATGCCGEENIKHLLANMKNIPGWMPEMARSALEVAGFDPAQFLE